MNASTKASDDYCARNRKKDFKLLAWTISWVITMVVADKAELYDWFTSDGLRIAAVLVNAALGLGVILSYRHYLSVIDEMQRKIQLEALSLSLGVSLVGTFTYSLLVTMGFVTDVDISDLTLLMTGTYVLGVVAGLVKYR